MNNKKIIRILSIISLILPVIYIILSLINIYNVNISVTIFHKTYEKWKDTTCFTSLQSTQREEYIYSITAVLPFIAVCVINIFSEKVKGFKKIRFSVLAFLVFLILNFISMDEIYQSTCSDDFMMIGLVSKLQNILMILNIFSFLLTFCASIIELRTESKTK
ncbi:MAG: hypothetical protein ACI4K5_03475 [Ruminococcus sp.]